MDGEYDRLIWCDVCVRSKYARERGDNTCHERKGGIGRKTSGK